MTGIAEPLVQYSVVSLYLYHYIVLCYYTYMNITIYINKRNEQRFSDEGEKSKLINTLLDNHYGASGAEVRIVKPTFTPPASGPYNLGTGKPTPNWVASNTITGERMDDELVKQLIQLKKDWPGYPFRINSDKEIVEVHNKRRNVWVDANEADLTEL